MIDKIRSVIFNVLFYGVLTPAVCIGLMPALIMPRRATHWVSKTYQQLEHLLEIYVMNMKMEVRGYENVPKDGNPYLVAAKHESAYETLKLLILFNDPTIILKKELLKIPFFGWFLKRLDVIAIDRSNREQAMSSLVNGARKMQQDKRPMVIFPQGTRVSVDATTAQKPYKGGIAKLYAATNLPIIPMAINTGVYWPRNSFWKKSGTVVIEFFPAIQPGLPEKEILPMLEQIIEPASSRLAAEGRAALAAKA